MANKDYVEGFVLYNSKTRMLHSNEIYLEAKLARDAKQKLGPEAAGYWVLPFKEKLPPKFRSQPPEQLSAFEAVKSEQSLSGLLF